MKKTKRVLYCTRIYDLKQQYKTQEIEDGEQITHYNRKATDVFGIKSVAAVLSSSSSTYIGGLCGAVPDKKKYVYISVITRYV